VTVQGPQAKESVNKKLSGHLFFVSWAEEADEHEVALV
jgi:hypothetical protein